MSFKQYDPSEFAALRKQGQCMKKGTVLRVFYFLSRQFFTEVVHRPEFRVANEW